ncbi:MAG: DUF3685 domain-containing protein [Synechococcaceae cyanobacterium RL_1_2]|nr:DUF3685 domain-containing protein [Synechococcaceae cyanobacterium RL_1_2]
MVPLLTKVVLQGQRRELRAAKAVVNYWLPPMVHKAKEKTPSKLSPKAKAPSPGELRPSIEKGDLQINPNLGYLQPILKPTLSRLSGAMVNLTGNALELDILKSDKKRELIYIVFQEFEQAIEQLKLVQIGAADLSQNYLNYLREIWHTTTTKFLTKYYFLEYPASPYNLPQLLVQESTAIEDQALSKIPYGRELFAYLLWQHPLELDHIPYRFNSPEANDRAELLFQNLILRIANGVVQTILNNFADNEVVKYQLIDAQYTSTRALTKFRNNLSREYRNDQWWYGPISIFESKYQILSLTNRGLEWRYIYGARQQELAKLQGIPLLVTFLLETKDTLQPVLKAFIAWVGSSLVYLLTQVLGRGIGLIGRGILQAIGHSFQENQK